jgi:hypothetical protein
MSSPQPQGDSIMKDVDAGLLHRVVLVATMLVMAGYIMHRIGRIEAVVENLVVVAQSDNRRLSELEAKR